MNQAFDSWLAQPLSEQSGLSIAQRQQAREGLQRFGFPQANTEAWKYTSLRQLHQQVPSLNLDRVRLDQPSAAALLSAAAPQGLPEHRVVFIDGNFYPELSVLGDYELSVADPVTATELIQHLGGAEDAFVRLVLAYAANAWRLQPRSGASGPLTVFHISSPLCHTNSVDQLYLQFHLPAKYRASLLECFYAAAADDGKRVYNYCLDIHLSPTSELQHGRSFSVLNQTQTFARSEVNLAERANYHAADVLCGEAQLRHELRVRYQGERGSAHFYSAARLSGKARLDQDWLMSHHASHCQTGQTFRAAVDGYSRASYTGRALIPQNVAASSVQQTSRGLMLSDDSEVNARPVLEIYADEVQANHGATVGCLDETALHYLCARGIQRELARMMLIDAFVSSALADFPEGRVKAELVRQLHGHGFAILDLDTYN